MQNFSLETNILHKTQTHLQQMTEEGSIQHCIKVNKCKLVVNWSKMKQFFFNFSFHKNTFFFLIYFFPPTFRKLILKIKWEFYLILSSDIHSLLISTDLMQKFSLTGLSHPSLTAEKWKKILMQTSQL